MNMGCLNDTVNLADQKCPPDQSQLNFFTEIAICEHLVIPPQKPDKELITNVIKNFIIDDVQVLEVDLGDREGTIADPIREKVVFTGNLKLGIEYSADMPEQQVHFAQFDIPFQGLIGYRPCVAGGNRGLIDPLEVTDFDIDDYFIHVCLEHEQYHQLSPREIKAVIVLLVWLEPKTP